MVNAFHSRRGVLVNDGPAQIDLNLLLVAWLVVLAVLVDLNHAFGRVLGLALDRLELLVFGVVLVEVHGVFHQRVASRHTEQAGVHSVAWALVVVSECCDWHVDDHTVFCHLFKKFQLNT